jgi:hypothetical protein
VDLIIDSNVFAAYYRASVLGTQPDIEGDPIALFDSLGGSDFGFLDSDGMIVGEWRKRAEKDAEWFDEWLAGLLVDGYLMEIGIDTCLVLLRKLWGDCGFPKQSRDKWYVRAAHTQSQTSGQIAAIVTEDVDFFEPAAKKDPKKRARHLKSGNGKVAKLLRKHDVDPRTLTQHLGETSSDG